MHDDFGKQFRLKPLEVARPFFVVVNAHRQADGARVVLSEIREALARIDDIAVLADRVLTGFGTAVIGNGIGRAIDSASPAGVAESSDACIDGLVCFEGNDVATLPMRNNGPNCG